MFPFLDLKIFRVPMYGLCMTVGIYAGFFVAYKLINNKQKFLDFVIVAILSLAFGIIGAKILYILTAHPVAEFFVVVWRMLFTKGNPELSGGFVFFGGLIFAPIGYLIGCKIAKCKLGDFLNEAAVVVPFGHAFGRIGCFCGGCCYGILYEGFGHVIYKNTLSDVPAGVGIFPVQLLEAFLLFVIFAGFLVIFLKKRRNLGEFTLFPFYILTYSIVRFGLEFLRGDSERGFFWIFSTSQWICILGVAISVVWILRCNAARKRKA